MVRVAIEYRTCLELALEYGPQSSTPSSCEPSFDRTLCWKPQPVGELALRDCPFEFCSSCDIEDRFAYRQCLSNGTWEQTNYNSCIVIFTNMSHCIASGCSPCADPLKDAIRITTLLLCVLSVLLLLITLLIFVLFKSLHCRRLTIHINLVVAFIFRFTILTAWILLHQYNVFSECNQLVKEPREDLEWICKNILWWTIYFQAASVFWMFVEGAHLMSRFTVFAMRHSEGPLIAYFAVGWGVPLLAVLVWSLLVETHSATMSFCWIPFTQSEYIWVLVAPMGGALVMNFIFLLIIIVILVQKLRAENTAESQKIWKAIKATLLLVPLLGVANILLFYEPAESADETFRNAYMLISAVLQHSQGMSVAILYCFANSEVQTALKRYFAGSGCLLNRLSLLTSQYDLNNTGRDLNLKPGKHPFNRSRSDMSCQSTNETTRLWSNQNGASRKHSPSVPDVVQSSTLGTLDEDTTLHSNDPVA